MSARGGEHLQKLSRYAYICLAIFTALIGAALGAVVDLFAGVPGTTDFVIRLWVTIGLTATGAVALVGYGVLSRRRSFLLSQRGTSYVVDSPADTWTPDDKNAYMLAGRTQFADVLEIAGPTGLSSSWRWPLTKGAEQWSDAVDDLVISFRSVMANDDPRTPSSVVCWAWYPVAIAWTARACSQERNLPIAIRQRPSTGRAKDIIEMPDWNQPVHSFVAAPASDRPRGTVIGDRAVELRLAAGDPANPDRTEDAVGPSELGRISILLVRLHDKEWAGLSPGTDGEPVSLEIANWSGRSIGLRDSAVLHEWRCLAGTGVHRWSDYPDLVSEIVRWIAATADPDGVNLLGMLVPQEVGLGIGLQVAKLTKSEWPAHLWPLIQPSFRAKHLTIPGLDLGWESLHQGYRVRSRD